MDVVIRTYEPADRDGVVALWRSVWPNPRPHNDPGADIDRMISVSPDLFVVAEVENSVGGTVMAGWDGQRGWIYRLAVRPELRRRGIGSLLMGDVEDRLASRGCHKVNLQLRPDDKTAVAFYEALGFAVEPRTSMGKLL